MNSNIRRINRATRRRAAVRRAQISNHLSKKTLKDDLCSPIISLTSYGERLKTVYITIETFFQQSVLPGAIYLWLHETDLPDGKLPKSLVRLRARGVNIEFVPENVRGAKKLVYAAQRFPERIIVTADDDCLYSADWLAELWSESLNYPDTVIACRAWFLFLASYERLAPYEDFMHESRGGASPSFNILPTGNAGVLYPPKSLHETIADTALMLHLCPNADDVWFKAMTMLNHVKSKRLNNKNVIPFGFKAFNNSLWDENKDRNDNYLKAVFDYFDLYELLE